MPDDVEHVPGQVGTHDAEGFRTHMIPGDVCLGCSDLDAGRWVAVSECPTALRVYERREAEIERLQQQALDALTDAEAADFYYEHRHEE